MRILVVKLTSMGDVLHLLPALTDLRQQQPEAIVDWMVEDSFAEIPAWHPSIDRVIKVSTRRWRRFNPGSISEFIAFLRTLRRVRYDYVIDAQGLLKSAVFTRFAKLNKGGVRAGFSRDSIKESPAAVLYKTRIQVARKQHAIARLRQLFAGVFNYRLPTDEIDYGLQPFKTGLERQRETAGQRVIMLFHGTTWPTKHLPDQVWRDLVDLITDDGYRVKVCWGNEDEKRRALWIAQERKDVSVMPKSTLNELALELANACGAVAVDTGLGHMAASLGIPTVSIYGSTDARLTGALGKAQIQLQSQYPCSPCILKQCDKLTQHVIEPPCYQRFDAATIWQKLHEKVA